MKKWEYKILDTKDVPGGGFLTGKSQNAIENYLNNLGEQGWEIVNFDPLEFQGHRLTFLGIAKREKS